MFLQATEMVEEARLMEPSAARTELLTEAVRMLKVGVQKLTLSVICQLLFEGIYCFLQFHFIELFFSQWMHSECSWNYCYFVRVDS